MNDVIRLTGVRARGNHGVFEHERRDGQEFVVDVAVEVDAHDAARVDDLDRTVHYGLLAEGVVRAVEEEPVDLIETLAERIAAVALSFPATLATEVTVHKPEAPITVPFGDVSITIRRVRERHTAGSAADRAAADRAAADRAGADPAAASDPAASAGGAA